MLTGNQKYVVSIFVPILLVFGMYSVSYADITPVSERTPQVRDAIVAAVPGISSASDVTDAHLAAVTRLNIRFAGITSLKSGDFSGLSGLTELNLYRNELRSLPDGIFKSLTALTTLRLGGNTVDPLPITVSLEKVGDNQLKAVMPTGAPSNIVVPISSTNGSIANSVTSLTIAKGRTESSAVAVSRIADTTAAVTVNIGTLPSLPRNHYGYTLSKSSVLPVEIISEVISDPPPSVEPPVEPEPPIVPLPKTAPIFTDGSPAIRSIAENTASGTNIGTAVSATDANENDTLTYTLSGVDAASFDIDSTSGQLKTKSALDYETKRVYQVTISVSDSTFTDSITVIISVIDVDDTPFVSTILTVSDRTPQVREAIVTAVPGVSSANDVTDAHLAAITSLNLRSAGITELKSGDFSGMTGLTSINLYGNMLSTLPTGVFKGLISLNTLRLGGNLVDPMPLIVSVQQIDASKFQAVVPIGAPFDIVLPIGAMLVTIPKGSLTSASFTDTNTPSIGALPGLPVNHFSYILSKSTVCNRTIQVSDAIVDALPDIDDCRNVSDVHLATITSLDLSSMSLTSLLSDDFSGLLSLTSIDLSNNQLESLPDSIFDGLTSLSNLDLRGNSVDPLPLLVSLKKVGINQFIVVLPSGAPSDIMLPISVTNGNLAGNVTHIMIPAGSIESQPHRVLRASDTFAAVSVDIGSVPRLPAGHTGYVLAKSNELPLEIFSGLNVAPVFTEGATTTRIIAENTAADTNIGSAISATDADDDILTYSLSGTDASSFSIDSSAGKLRTSAPLDYETKTSYSVIITVSDGKGGSDSISVTINITDVDEALPNNAPVFTDGDSTTRSVAEDTGSGVDIGSAVSATDVDDDVLTYSLSGTDASSFSINSTNGQLRTSAALDYETDTSYSVTITVSDGKGGSDSISVTINITDVDEALPNNAPVFTDGDSTTRSVAENTGSGVDIGAAVSATDADSDTLEYSLSGTDAAAFTIDSTIGQLRTNALMDFETKSNYTVTVIASDGTDEATITVTINVIDATENRAPVFSAGSSTTRSVSEDTGSGVDIGSAISATDADNDTLTYTLGGTDASTFSIDSTNGQLRTDSFLDYETKSSYTVIITVSDGTLTDTITVTINITDVAETPTNSEPVFDEGSITSRSVLENTNSGVDIGSAVSATDADDDTLSYSLGGTDDASFSIDSSSGQISTSSLLNYEFKDSYSVTIIASDGSLTSSIDVTIDVIDGNDAPVFSAGSSTSRIVAEDAAISANVGTVVSATDEDGDNLTYSLGGTDAASFSIDNTTGQLKSGITFNTTTKTTYSVIVTASDGNLADTITVTITIRSVNDAPVFTEGNSTTRAIAENNAVNANIGAAVSATDADNDSLTYTLGGTDAVSFSIVSTSGQLRANAPLNYETKDSYSVTITASDGNLTDTITITINVTDANDAPVFSDGASTTRAIAENTGIGLNIGAAVSATDEDEDNLTYTLGGTDAAAFDIGSTTGQLQTKSALDYEDKNEYTVTVAVNDGNGGTDTITVTINVTDLEETPANNPPVFTDDTSTTRSVTENSVSDTNIGTPVAATDADNNTLAYLLGGTDAASFAIDSGTGQLKTNAPIDHEDKDEYTVTVNVNDGSTTVSITVTINVTDANDAPIFTDGTSTTRSVAENTTTGVDIGGAIPATDQDGDDLTYTLGGTDASSFGIVSTSGQLQTNALLNYENKDSYAVTITVSDGTLTDTIDVTINVTDANDAPNFTEGDSTTRSVSENTSSNTNIGTAVAAPDSDDDDLTYTLGGTDASSFSIVSTSGQLQTNASLDFETKTSYSVTISVSDGNGGTDSISVTINVTDINENRSPMFTDGTSTSRSVAENTASGQDIGSPVTAADPDDDDLTYTLGGTDAASFSIVNTSGQLRTIDALDFESKSSYSVTITVSDTKLTDSITVTINVTDVDENRAPSFTDGTSTTRSIAENTGSGQDIGSAVSATDPDEDDLTYTLGGTDAASFDINSTNGQLRTSAALDYETKTSYSVTIIVSDDNLTDSITVTINVTDVDENRAPTFTEGTSTTRSIAENTGAGVNIGSAVSATDLDNDDLTYSLGGTDASSFSINSTNGQLRTSAALDYETKTSYSVTISVSDGNGGTDSISVTIDVTDINENRSPMFTDGTSTSRSVAENTASGQDIGSPVTATDPDDDDLTYTLGGTDAASFSIVSTSGQMQTRTELDYETKLSYSVTITASDSKLTDTINVTINVTDVDENRAPSFTDGASTTRSIAENTGSGQDIGTAVTATDPDNNDLTYTLGGTDAASFSINGTTGQLRTNASLNHESKSSYSVTVSVSDGNGGTDSISVTINVTNVNEAPSFSDGTSTTRSIAENTAANTNIGSAVSATDVDSGTTLTYTLGGTDAASFSIVSTSGQLQTSAALDYETKTSYTVTVSVSDGNSGSDSITVTINVTDVEEIDPPLSERTQQVQDAIVAAVTGVTNVDDVTAAHLAAITSLDLSDKSITSLKAGDFDGLIALRELDLADNSLSDISSLEDLTNLRRLNLFRNSISDISSLEDLTNLRRLDLHGNSASDISPLKNLTALTTLELYGNSISDISPLEGLTKLTELTLSGNSASDISPLEDLTALTTLRMNHNSISDISPLEGLTNLTSLFLYDNSISDISPLEGLTNLTSLLLSRNNDISDYGPLRRLIAAIEAAGRSLSLDITIPPVNVNNAPSFTDGSSTTRTVAENTATGQNIGSAVAATDVDSGDTLTYTLGGTDASSFSIVSTSGQLQTNAALDYETKSSYSVTVKVTDDSGASNNSATITVTINVTESENPSVTITVPSGTQGAYDAERRYRTFEVTVAFSEVVTGFEKIELVLAGTASVVVVSMTTTDNITYTFTIEPNGSGTLTFNVAADAAFDTENNGNTVADEQSVTIDADEPTVELTLPEEPQGSVFSVTITFSEPVNGFEQTDLEIDNVGADWLENEDGSSITDWTASEDRTTYTAEITSTEGMAVYFKVSGRIATDDAGNGNRGTVGKERVFLTIGPPVLVSFRYSGHRYLKDPTDAFIVFNESVTGFGKDDLTLSDNTAGATITNWEAKEDGRTYVATVTAETSGEVKLTVPANVATDDDENTNANSKELTLEFDLVAPTITMSTLEGAIIRPGGRFQLNVWFSESVAGFRPSIVDDPQEISVTGGTANLEYWTSKINDGHWSTLNNYFKFRISVDNDATEVVISIDAGAAEDPAGNGNVAASLTLTVTNDANNAPALQIPKTTTLLANYPNPFNPETWIPYQLSKSADVTLTIYDMRGVVVRELKLGHQAAGVYTSRNRAIHWDGRNSIGEKVATGVYFYTLKAGEYSATRKMLIRK